MDRYPRLSSSAYKDKKWHRIEMVAIITNVVADAHQYYKRSLTEEEKTKVLQALSDALPD